MFVAIFNFHCAEGAIPKEYGKYICRCDKFHRLIAGYPVDDTIKNTELGSGSQDICVGDFGSSRKSWFLLFQCMMICTIPCKIITERMAFKS